MAPRLHVSACQLLLLLYSNLATITTLPLIVRVLRGTSLVLHTPVISGSDFQCALTPWLGFGWQREPEPEPEAEPERRAASAQALDPQWTDDLWAAL